VEPKDGFVLVGYMDDDGRLCELRVPTELAHMARERGWMIWEDFELSVIESPDHEDGA